jgi:hypothetical protein
LKKQIGSPEIPQWIPLDTWAAFVEMRRKVRKPMTGFAIKLIFDKLKKLAQDGDSPKEILEQSIRNSWQDVFAVKRDNGYGLKSDKIQQARRDKFSRVALGVSSVSRRNGDTLSGGLHRGRTECVDGATGKLLLPGDNSSD